MQRIVSASLAVWLSGFVLLFCCGKMEAQTAEYCPLAKAEKHCNKTKAGENQTSFSDVSGSSFDCCNFLPAIFDKVRKLEKNLQTAQFVDKIKLERPQIFSFGNNLDFSENYRPPLSYDRNIFIKNRVLRI